MMPIAYSKTGKLESKSNISYAFWILEYQIHTAAKLSREMKEYFNTVSNGHVIVI